MTDLSNKSFEWLAGYHAAMNEVAQQCAIETKQLDQAQAETSRTIFGNPTPTHHKLSGASTAIHTLGEFVFLRANEAFAARKSAT